jgi:uncharacterized protein (TIGR02266 family)
MEGAARRVDEWLDEPAPVPVEPRHLQLAPGDGQEPSPRWPVDLPVTLRWSGRDRRRSAVDVSTQGMFAESADHAKIGELVQVVVQMHDGGGALRVLCTVERVVLPDEAAFCGGMPGMGLRFFLMDAAVRARWDEYLRHVERGTLPYPPDPKKCEHMKDVPLKLTRRGETRKPARFRVKLADRESLQEFHTKNVSRGGMFIGTAEPLDPGAKISLFVVHPVTGREYALEAQVRWVRKDVRYEERGMGVQILGQEAETEEEFVRFMNEG